MSRCWSLIAAIVICSGVASAEERVFTSTGGENAPRAFTGKIVDYNGKEMRFETATGQAIVIPAGRVLQVTIERKPSHAEADRLASQRQYAEAIAAYRTALSEEQRPWVKRRMMADVTTCYESLGQLDRAGEAFAMVMKSDEHWQYLERIPCSWSGGLIDSSFEQQAKSWLASADPPVQLLGASYLLGGPDRAAATAALRKLSSATDPRIAHLADAQMWRANIATVGPQELKAWELQVERMPANLRSGPYLVVGKGWLQQDARMLGPSDEIYRRAVWAFLKPPILYPERPAHAISGLTSAAETLAKLPWDDETQSVLRELATQFPESEAGKAAARRLQPR